MTDLDRKIEHIGLRLTGRIYEVSPVQAEGEIDGNPFYFRARHDEWTFAISENLEIDPVDIQTLEAGMKYGFFKEALHGKKGSEFASYMDVETAEKLIINSCLEYRALTNKS